MFHQTIRPEFAASPAITAMPPLPSQLPTQSVLGLPVVDATTQTVVTSLLKNNRSTAFFINAHCANIRVKDRAYAAALARADVVLPDGIGIKIAARMTGSDLTENLNGTDLTPVLLQHAADQGLSVFLLGAQPGTAAKAGQTLQDKIPHLNIVGTLNGFEDAQDEQALIAQINASGADILIVAMGVPLQELWIDRNRSALNPRLVMGVGALFDFLAGNVTRAPAQVRQLGMEWLWRLSQEPVRLANRYIVGNATFLVRATGHALRTAGPDAVTKRVLDITLSALLITLTAPLLLLTALLIRLDSKGPAVFCQERVGRNGRTFKIYKFRSMFADAEARLAAVKDMSDREGICFKSQNDPRITRMGRFLRRTSIDELPQILNVLFGDMSLVGPRPALPREVAEYPAAAMERLAVRPGITGLWQVSGRADIGFDKMIDMDVAYVRSKSVVLDLVLLGMTFQAVTTGRGAY